MVLLSDATASLALLLLHLCGPIVLPFNHGHKMLTCYGTKQQYSAHAEEDLAAHLTNHRSEL
jgi:hypothetical protein